MKKILEFQNVTVRAQGDIGITFRIDQSDFIFVLLEDGSDRFPLCDLAEGLQEPTYGWVEFMGERWNDMRPFRQSEMRGRIGRVFEENGWVSNLSIYENIALSQRHHTTRPEHDIRVEAEHLAHLAGLDSVPDTRPHRLGTSRLRAAEWVRAFIGAPALVLLEQPEMGVSREQVKKLMNMVVGTLSKGSAVVWTTMDVQLWRDKTMDKAKRYNIRDTSMTCTEKTV